MVLIMISDSSLQASARHISMLASVASTFICLLYHVYQEVVACLVHFYYLKYNQEARETFLAQYDYYTC